MAKFPAAAQELDGSMKVSDSTYQKEVLEEVLKELKKITFLLSILAETEPETDEDKE